MTPGYPLRLFRLVLVLAGTLCMSALFASAPARADLRICNQTANPVSIALGYRAGRGWQSEGWWVAPPTECATVFEGDLSSRYYYLFIADDIGGGSWDGDVTMCTRDETFTISGVEDCLARGYEPAGFFEVDTENRQDWTLQLTDGAPGEGDVPDADGIPLDGVAPDTAPDTPSGDDEDVPPEEPVEP